MARSSFDASEDSLEALKAEFSGRGAGWMKLAPWAAGAAGLGFAAYLFLGPYRALTGELARRSGDLAAERAAHEETTKERDKLKVASPASATTPERAMRLAKFNSMTSTLTEKLRTTFSAGGAEINAASGRILLRFPEEAIFDGKGADLSEAGEGALKALGAMLKDGMGGMRVFVAAHVDPGPSPKELRDMYPTSWELSSARATNAVRFLQEEGGVPPAILFAVAGADHHPAPRTRRLDIEIEPE